MKPKRKCLTIRHAIICYMPLKLEQFLNSFNRNEYLTYVKFMTMYFTYENWSYDQVVNFYYHKPTHFFHIDYYVIDMIRRSRVRIYEFGISKEEMLLRYECHKKLASYYNKMYDTWRKECFIKKDI